MRFLNEKALRHFLRRIISEDVYGGGVFSPDMLQKSIINYTMGDLVQRGLQPAHAREVALDDLRVAFGEAGYDLYTDLQDMIADGDRDAVESRVREILEKDFVGPMGPLKNLGIRSLDDILLPGDFDELIDLIVGDMFDGDGMITIR